MKPGQPRAPLRQLAHAHRERLNAHLQAHPEKERLRASLHLLLSALLAHCSPENVQADGRAVCWLSLQTIATAYGFPPRTIRRIMRELESTGVISAQCGSAVPAKYRGTRDQHDQGFFKADGSRVTVKTRGYLFVFAEPLRGSSATLASAGRPSGVPAPVEAVTPIPRSAPSTRQLPPPSTDGVIRSLVPRLPPAKRAEVEAEIGVDACTALVAWVMAEWSRKVPEPARPFDFWNARLAEWRERSARTQAAAVAEADVAKTEQATRTLQADVARTADDRKLIAAALAERLSSWPAGGARV